MQRVRGEEGSSVDIQVLGGGKRVRRDGFVRRVIYLVARRGEKVWKGNIIYHYSPSKIWER